MGCGQKAVADDEDDQDRFNSKHGVNYKVYSREASIAEQGVAKYKFTSTLLQKYVQEAMKLHKAEIDFHSSLSKLIAVNNI